MKRGHCTIMMEHHSNTKNWSWLKARQARVSSLDARVDGSKYSEEGGLIAFGPGLTATSALNIENL